jgi:lipopolysaccharide transport system permease protein
MAQKEQENEKWTTVIKPRNGLFEVNLKEIWDYRDLYTMFVKRDITVAYKQTILGPLWWLIQPALTVIMYMVVFGGIAGILVHRPVLFRRLRRVHGLPKP